MLCEIAVALDFESVHEAQDIVDKLGDHIWYKIGLELAFAPGAINFVRSLDKVFLDLKLRDIPTTVERASRNIAMKWKPKLLTVSNYEHHAIKATKDLPTEIVSVPQLTSEAISFVCVVDTPWVVCRNSLANSFKKINPGVKCICPGVRWEGTGTNDHTAVLALNENPELNQDRVHADMVVIGRPITRAEDPKKEFYKFFEALRHV